MNSLLTQHRQDLERVARVPSGQGNAVLGEQIDIQLSDACGVRRSVEGRRKLWTHPVVVGSAVLAGKEISMPDLNCYLAVWCDVAFTTGVNGDGNEFNDGGGALQARWECVPVKDFDYNNDVIVPADADIITAAGDFARYRASFGVVMAQTREVENGEYRLVSRVTGLPVSDSFLPYFTQILIPDFTATPPIALF
jgi:hypothetical protein